MKNSKQNKKNPTFILLDQIWAELLINVLPVGNYFFFFLLTIRLSNLCKVDPHVSHPQ